MRYDYIFVCSAQQLIIAYGLAKIEEENANLTLMQI